MTTSEQLTFDGSPARKARRMNRRQKDLWLWMAFEPHATMTTGAARRFYRDPHGALERLVRMGVVEKVGRGRWRAI